MKTTRSILFLILSLTISFTHISEIQTTPENFSAQKKLTLRRRIKFLLAQSQRSSDKKVFIELYDKLICASECLSKKEINKPLDEYQHTLLHYAVAIDNIAPKAHATLIRTLLSAGANPNAENTAGNTPLHLMLLFKTQNKGMITPMIGKGVKLDKKNNHGKTPLHLTATSKDEECIDVLFFWGRKFINMGDAQGTTPAQELVQHNYSPKTLKFLNKFRINYTQPDRNGITLNDIIEKQKSLSKIN